MGLRSCKGWHALVFAVILGMALRAAVAEGAFLAGALPDLEIEAVSLGIGRGELGIMVGGGFFLSQRPIHVGLGA